MTKSPDQLSPQNVAGVILAGGQSRRFGDGDKFLKALNGKLLIEHVIETARPQMALSR